jgi:hypothetical protein
MRLRVIPKHWCARLSNLTETLRSVGSLRPSVDGGASCAATYGQVADVHMRKASSAANRKFSALLQVSTAMIRIYTASGLDSNFLLRSRSRQSFSAPLQVSTVIFCTASGLDSNFLHRFRSKHNLHSFRWTATICRGAVPSLEQYDPALAPGQVQTSGWPGLLSSCSRTTEQRARSAEVIDCSRSPPTTEVLRRKRPFSHCFRTRRYGEPGSGPGDRPVLGPARAWLVRIAWAIPTAISAISWPSFLGPAPAS